MPQIKRMLVPTDFSSTSAVAFNYAVDMAAREGSAVLLLHVIDEASFATAYPDGFYVELPGLHAELMAEGTQRLEDLAARCRARNVATTLEVKIGRPATVIADTAVAHGTDLIVMGTHGRSGFAHLMMGSVAERVLRTAPCPVLTVRDTARVADALGGEAATPDALRPAFNPQ